MERTIRITGIGTAKRSPDTIQIPMTVNTKARTYEKAVKEASEIVSLLSEAVQRAGFSRNDLKTTGFSVDSEYSSKRDKNDNYVRVFEGYRCSHSLKIEFGFDIEMLSDVMKTISESGTCPELDIRFFVKDAKAIKAELLETAAIDANVKALALCRASGTQLGKLLSIDYSWSQIDLYSNTDFEVGTGIRALCESAPVFVPEDIEAKDSVTFVWEIL